MKDLTKTLEKDFYTLKERRDDIVHLSHNLQLALT